LVEFRADDFLQFRGSLPMASDLNHETPSPTDRFQGPRETAFAMLADPTLILDEDGTIRFASDSLFPALGWQPIELIGERADCLFADYYGEQFDQHIRGLTWEEGGGIQKSLLELEAKRKNGTTYACEVSISHGMSAESSKMVTIALRDITTSRIREKQFNLGFHLFTAGPVVIFHWSLEEGWPVEFVSQNVDTLLGYTARDFISRQVLYADIIHPEDRSRLREKKNRSIQSGIKRFEQDYRIVRADGEVRWLYDFTILSRQGDGPPHCAGYVLDITDIMLGVEKLRDYSDALVEANASLVAAKAQAEAATKAKSDFLANMSHEIRTPMTAILGYTDVLEPLLGDGQGGDMLGIIRSNGKYLLELINDILDLAKIEAGKLVLSISRVSPVDVVEQVLKLMQVRAQEKNLDFSVEFMGKIPETIAGDAIRLRQILINIVGNAIKFTDSGHVKIRVHLSDECDSRPMILFEVEDTGVGMNEVAITRLFQPFVQANTSATREFGGTGLGLSITMRLTRLMEGGISVRSKRGEGSVFTVSISAGSLKDVPMHVFSESSQLPTALTPALSEEQTTPAKRVPTRQCVQNDIMAGVTILLAEDNSVNRRLIHVILESAGATVTEVDNGQSACELALSAWRKGDPYDVVLMDVQMPILDGLSATRKIRDDGYKGKIIALTAHAMESDKGRCLDAGCDSYCTKPIDRELLFKEILA
jgi:PAS domain S-box-containing protein